MGYTLFQPDNDFTKGVFVIPAYVTDSAGTPKDPNYGYSPFNFTQNVPADGDKVYAYLMGDGTETKLDLGYTRYPSGGIFDVYLNGVLELAGVDGYVAGGDNIHQVVSLAHPTLTGVNVIKLQANGKNGASTGYRITIGVLRLRV